MKREKHCALRKCWVTFHVFSCFHFGYQVKLVLFLGIFGFLYNFSAKSTTFLSQSLSEKWNPTIFLIRKSCWSAQKVPKHLRFRTISQNIVFDLNVKIKKQIQDFHFILRVQLRSDEISFFVSASSKHSISNPDNVLGNQNSFAFQNRKKTPTISYSSSHSHTKAPPTRTLTRQNEINHSYRKFSIQIQQKSEKKTLAVRVSWLLHTMTSQLRNIFQEKTHLFIDVSISSHR